MSRPAPNPPGRVKTVLLHIPILLCLGIMLFRPGMFNAGLAMAAVVWQAGVSIWIYAKSYAVDRHIIKSLESMVVKIENGDWDSLKTLEEGRLAGLQQSLHEALLQTRHHEKQLHGQREYMKEFISHISHQMKTPLAALSMYVELMEDEKMEPATRAEFLQRSSQQLERLQWLIQSLLQIAKLEADSILLDCKKIPMEYIIEAAVDGLEIIAEAKGVVIDWKDECNETRLLLDEKWMVQAVENIIKNGIEHTPPGGSLRIWTAENRFTLSVYIEDDGQGMDSQQIAKVFEPFYSRKKDDVSVGLGLALSKAIVVKHGGQIFVRSTLGEGTRFELVFNK